MSVTYLRPRDSTPSAVSKAIAAMDATQATAAQPGIFPSRNAATVYADGFLTQDASGIYRGDGATAGGVMQASPSFNVAASKTFSRTGAAVDPKTGAVAAENVENTRTLLWPKWNDGEKNPAFSTYAISGKTVLAMTATGALLAKTTADGTTYIHRSVNSGSTWTSTTLIAGGNLLSVHIHEGPTKEIILACSDQGGIYVSVDDGVTWSSNRADTTHMYGIRPYFRGCWWEQTKGTAKADRKLIFTPYGNELSSSSQTLSAYGRVSIFRTLQTLAEIEAAPDSLSFELLWRLNAPDYYAASGMNRYPAAEVVPDGVVGSATGNTLVEMGKFAGKTLQYDHVEILTGDGAGQVRSIASHDDDTLTIYGTWSVTPSASDTYRVVELFPTGGHAMHLHSGLYVEADANGDECLFLSFGDGNSNGILRIADPSTLLGRAFTDDQGPQPHNWDATSLCSTARQPTHMEHDSVRHKVLWIATDDSSYGIVEMDDASPFAYATVLTDDFTYNTTGDPPLTFDFPYPYDGVRSGNVVMFSTNRYSGTDPSGLWVAPVDDLQNAVRVARSLAADWGWIYGSQSRPVLPNLQVEMPDDWFEHTAVFLGSAVTNLAPNPEFAGSGTPTSWSSSGSATYSLHTGAGIPGGGQLWRITKESANTGTLNPTTNIVVVAGEQVEFTSWVRQPVSALLGSLSLQLYWYTGGTYVSNVSESTGSGPVNKWARMRVRAQVPASIDRVQCRYRVAGVLAGVVDVAYPTITRAVDLHAAGTRSADVLEYACSAASYAVGRSTQLEFYLKPLRPSNFTRTVTEDIVSIEDFLGYRALLQYTDNGSGTKAFQLVLADPAGTPIATVSLGYVLNTQSDTARVRIIQEDGLIRAQMDWGYESLAAVQPWTRPWWPKQIEYGVNQWSAGTRFEGWYAHAGVTQR